MSRVDWSRHVLYGHKATDGVVPFQAFFFILFLGLVPGLALCNAALSSFVTKLPTYPFATQHQQGGRITTPMPDSLFSTGSHAADVGLTNDS